MFRIIGTTNYQFLDWRRQASLLSGFVVLVGLVAMVLQGGLNFGIDFSGGNLLHLEFEQPVTISDVRASLAGINLSDSEIKFAGSERDVLIRVPEQPDVQSVPDLVREELEGDFSANPFLVLRQEHVGPRIGRELIYGAIYAILVSLLLLVIYISIRFEFKFAMGALVALAHDVLVTIAVLSITNREVSLAIVAALLTIVGYSLNDTIVVFDRMRENFKVLRRESYHTIINTSINQTLSRTLITSGTTLLVVGILYAFGGTVINGFAFALLVGIVAGTYSSIYVASPVVVYLHDRAEAAARQRRV